MAQLFYIKSCVITIKASFECLAFATQNVFSWQREVTLGNHIVSFSTVRDVVGIVVIRLSFEKV